MFQDKPDLIKIGYVVKPHGLKGEIKVMPCENNQERIKGYKSICLESGDQKEWRHVESVRWNKEFALIKFKGITDAENAGRYRGWSLLINSNMLAELPANTYYQFQIQGCRVNNTEGQTLGSVESVTDYPANDVYTVRTEQGKLIDIPAVRELIKNVDVENKVITVYGDKLQEIGE